MAGKISGATGGMKNSGGKNIPTASWDVQHQQEPQTAGAMRAGGMLKKILNKSRNAKGLS